MFILGQVIVNAAKYGATTLMFTAREEEPGTLRGRTVLEVRDNGCGIPAADVPHARARFHRSGRLRPRFRPRAWALYLVASLCASMGLQWASPARRAPAPASSSPSPRPHPQGTLLALRRGGQVDGVETCAT